MDDKETKKRKLESEDTEVLFAEMDKRQDAREEAEQDEQQDLNQGMQTGTHDAHHPGIKWGPSYQVKKPKAKSQNSGKS